MAGLVPDTDAVSVFVNHVPVLCLFFNRTLLFLQYTGISLFLDIKVATFSMTLVNI